MSHPEILDKPVTRWVLLVFVVLLAASHLTRWLAPWTPPEATGSTSLAMAKYDPESDHPPPGEIELAYRDLAAAGGDAPALVLLHGSPMRAEQWEPLVDELGSQFRLIVPALNGSGGSSRDLPDYSCRAAANYVAELIAELKLGKVHLAGFSSGATAALYIAATHPDKVASLTLLTPMAVEELELVGDATLNHTIYWAQKFYIWCGRNLVPHFGLLDRAPADRNYARHYYDSDLRRIPEILPEVVAPVRILHGRDDLVRPAAASRELARLLPQAELRLIDGGHEAPLEQPGEVAATLAELIADPRPDRAAADETRTGAADEPFEYSRYRDDLRSRVALMVTLLAIATLISEDITCITAGILAARGMLGLFPATLGCFLGILIGDTGLYLLGRVLGRRALRIPPLKWMVTEAQIDASERFFHRYGAALVIVTRWLPGMRIPTYVGAGMLKLKFRIFIFYFIIAAAIWTPLLVGISSLIGNTLLGWLEHVEDYAPLILLVIILSVWFAAKIIMGRASEAFEHRIEAEQEAGVEPVDKLESKTAPE